MSMYKKDTDDAGIPALLDKSTVLQEARTFNATPIMPRKCRILLAKIIYLLYQGETLGTLEATELFFSITKLFQNKDMSLRQMVYLAIKELSTISEDVIMVTSSLMRDMQPKSEVVYRGNAIRALCKITDVAMLPGIERFLKAAIVERNAAISSAALMSSYHLFWQAKDLIRRWGNEVQEALNTKTGGGGGISGLGGSFFGGSSGGGSNSQAAADAAAAAHSTMVQYHALGLLFAIRQHDRMAVAKLVQGFSAVGGGGGGSRGGFFGSSSGVTLRNNMAHCLLIRYACRVMENDVTVDRQLYTLLEEWSRHRSDMVCLEAIRAICNLRNMSDKDLASPIASLQLFLTSSKATVRFAGIRTLNTLAATHPAAVAVCNVDMENLITDGNRSVATFAITTLLKTGNEASVDRLVKQITSFLSDISSEFKVIVMEAIRALALKFPAKHVTMLTFLSNVLRDEGSYECKKAVVDAMLDMVKEIPECKEEALAHLCEFIEDCEFNKLSVRILHLLGEEGPTTPTPSIYIRHIYNRVILEKSVVRAAAVNALTKFAVKVTDPALQSSLRILLRRCLEDRDDEVRDRATWALAVCDSTPAADKYVRDTSSYDWEALELKLYQYCSDPSAAQQGEFDLGAVPQVSKAQADALRSQHAGRAITAELDAASSLPASRRGPGASPASAAAATAGSDTVGRAGQIDSNGPAPGEDSAAAAFRRQEQFASVLKTVPEFTDFGPLLVSSARPSELTEAETEYVVRCTKHIFRAHVVFQFDCTNTIPDQLLENALVVMGGEDVEGLEEVTTVPAPRLACDAPQPTYVAFRKTQFDGSDESALEPLVGTFTATLKFMVKDCDPTTGEPDSDDGFEDEYQLEDVELTLADWMQPAYLGEPAKVWAELEGSGAERVETFALSAFDNLQDALDSVTEIMGMYPNDQSHRVPPKKVSHTAVLTALYSGQVRTILRVRLTVAPQTGVMMELAVRSQSEIVSEAVMEVVA
ncbi:coatomer subunit gamma [Tieghemiomyces parasiticus]|uniref:Coatomer subunit gamma n=1 Tax=Tieghemiomyces parasiticus TaxID=78921 RepID=A0A9W8A8I9_9FUNG|nr:coatomer subunit gamma [Tieghemiomyces parasiticus]